MEQEALLDYFSRRIDSWGGRQFLSPENINKSNKNREVVFLDFAKKALPYISFKEPEDKKDEIEGLISEYRKIFGGGDKASKSS